MPRSFQASPALSFCVAILLLAGTVVSQSPAQQFSDLATAVEKSFSQPILEGAIPQAEVEAFCRARVKPFVAPLSKEAWISAADAMREEVLAKVVYRGPSQPWRTFKPSVEWGETLEPGEGYRIKKLRFEVLPGLWVPALLYEPKALAAKAPVFLNVNGHDSKGKAAGYKQIRCINLAKRGIIALNLEWFGMGQLRTPGFTHYKMNQLDLCGGSGVSVHLAAMQRALDLLLAHPQADPARVGVAGLSGGGWQTIFVSGLDTRVTLSNPVAGYSSFLTRIDHYSDLGDSEQTPCDLAAHADYAHLTAMLAPRGALLTFNEKDNCCFAAPHALPPLREAARSVYSLFGKTEMLHDHVNFDPGNHNFERDNRQALYRVVGLQFFPGDNNYSAEEFPTGGEVQTSEQLAVEMPESNLDFNKLAREIAGRIPKAEFPADQDALKTWQNKQRLAVSENLHYHAWKATAEAVGEPAEIAGAKVARWRLRIGEAWTVPATEFTPAELKAEAAVALLIADDGVASAKEQIAKLLQQGRRVLAVDPFYLGQSKIKSHGFLFTLLISSVGERPVGVQASQLAAVSRWLATERKLGPVELVSFGARTSLAALAAAACEPQAIAAVHTHGSLGSLREVIENDWQVNEKPEFFCFDQIRQADIPTLAALVAPRPVTFAEPTEPAAAELAPLRKLYATLGTTHDPLAR